MPDLEPCPCGGGYKRVRVARKPDRDCQQCGRTCAEVQWDQLKMWLCHVCRVAERTARPKVRRQVVRAPAPARDPEQPVIRRQRLADF